ncbi:MAG: single-stranded DNA-binding protein [Tannerella sp.]|jgi:single-strand DNA-binding protein|nr:single-stranded DNA-binding protein [Tannerella sp.]
MSLNKVILIGNVGKDPDVHYFESGQCVARFSLATSERGYKKVDGTEVPDRTEWHNIAAWKQHAQFVEKYVKKGSGLYVEGKIRYRDYLDKENVKRYTTEIYAERVEFYSLDRRPEGTESKETPVAAPVVDVPPPPTPADDLPF